MHLLVRRSTEANPARHSQRFEPRGNVDAVAEDVAILDDDVTRPVRTYPLRTSTAHSEPVLMIFTRMPPRRTHLGTKAFDR